MVRSQVADQVVFIGLQISVSVTAVFEVLLLLFRSRFRCVLNVASKLCFFESLPIPICCTFHVWKSRYFQKNIFFGDAVCVGCSVYLPLKPSFWSACISSIISLYSFGCLIIDVVTENKSDAQKRMNRTLYKAARFKKTSHS